MVLFARLTLAVSALLAVAAARAQDADFPQYKTSAKGYAIYRQFQTFDSVATTTPYWKKDVDLAVVSLKAEYYLNPESELEMELAIEHGGTGTALEYEPLEEFGEFDKDIEQGGEVVLEELYYRRMIAPMTWLRVGKIPVYVALGSAQENMLLYPSITPSTAEASMIPEEWREVGLDLQWRFYDLWSVRAEIVSGLNSEFFRKYNWIGGGYQRRFESVNVESLAGVAVLEYGDLALSDGIALAVYNGDTAGNRYKRNKTTGAADLTLVSLFGSYRFGQVGVRGQTIRGTLNKSDALSAANATLPSFANPGAYSQLGHEATLDQVELSYRWSYSDTSSLTPFAFWQHVDTMAGVEGAVLKDDRFNQLFTGAGLMWSWDSVMFLKAASTRRSTALNGLPDTNGYEVALGLDLKGIDY